MARIPLRERLLSLPTYSQELGLDLHRAEDRFRWFLASILFAKRISALAPTARLGALRHEVAHTVLHGTLAFQYIIIGGWQKL